MFLNLSFSSDVPSIYFRQISCNIEIENFDIVEAEAISRILKMSYLNKGFKPAALVE